MRDHLIPAVTAVTAVTVIILIIKKYKIYRGETRALGLSKCPRPL